MMTAGNSSAAELSQMADLLFEIGTEELPAWYPERATADMEQLLKAALANAGISHGEITRYSSPRRLALLVRDLPEYSERRTSKRRGPPVAAARSVTSCRVSSRRLCGSAMTKASARAAA